MATYRKTTRRGITYHRYRVRRKAVSGRVVDRWIESTDKAAARAMAAELEAKIVAGTYDADEPLPGEDRSIARLVDRYLTEPALHGDRTKAFASRELLCKYWRKRLGEMNVRDLTVARVLTEKSRLMNHVSRKTGRPYKPATVNHYLIALSCLMNVAISLGWIRESPVRAERVGYLRVKNQRTRFLDSETELPALLHECDTSPCPALGVVVRLAIWAGPRKGEIRKLRWSEVDFSRGALTFLDTKNGDDRTVPLQGPALEALLAWHRQCGEPVSGLVFPSPTHPSKAWRFDFSYLKAVERAGLKDFRFHDLRHTFASYCVMGGVDLYTLAGLMGHRDAKSTARYAHLADEHKRQMLQGMSQVFGDPTATPAAPEAPEAPEPETGHELQALLSELGEKEVLALLRQARGAASGVGASAPA